MMASKTPLEQTYVDQPFELIPRWLWSMGVGLILILGGIWLIWTRIALGSSWDANKSGTTSVESAPSAGQAAPDFELKNLAGETIRLADPIPQFGLPAHLGDHAGGGDPRDDSRAAPAGTGRARDEHGKFLYVPD